MAKTVTTKQSITNNTTCKTTLTQFANSFHTLQSLRAGGEPITVTYTRDNRYNVHNN